MASTTTDELTSGSLCFIKALTVSTTAFLASAFAASLCLSAFRKLLFFLALQSRLETSLGVILKR
jgi:hypothetical protein